MAKLRLEHIYKVYPNGTKAVSDFTMEIDDQEFIVFVGPSGCGKSTTLRMIAGLEDISAGELYIGDRIVNDVEPKDRDIAMVFQNYALYPHMTVYENMAFGLKLRHVPNAEIHEKVLWAAKVLDLTEYLDRKPRAMSGGQRQRVALGRAILRNPKVMLLDEPLSNLDAKLRAQMRSEIAKLHDELKTTFIYVTHDQVEAMTLGTRVVVMKLGRIMQIDTPKNLYDYPNNLFVAGFIGTPQMNFFEAKLTKKQQTINVDFEWSECKLEVPQAVLAKVQPRYFDGNTVVKVGLRCEHISLDPSVVENSPYLIDVRISHFEELGNETLIYGDINMQGDGFAETSTRVIIKGTSNYGLKKGDVVKAAVNVEKMHLFDKKTEQTINPRIPSQNLISAKVKDQTLVFNSKIKYKLPDAIKVEDGEYDILIPAEAIKLTDGTKHHVTVKTYEEINGVNLVGIEVNDQLAFTYFSEALEVGTNKELEIDFTQVEFIKDGQKVVEKLGAYDKINAMFINHATAKSFVGDKYEPVVQERINLVKQEYEPKIEQLTREFERECNAKMQIDTRPIIAENKKAIAQKTAEIKSIIAKLKLELKNGIKSLSDAHEQNKAKINAEVNALYEKIRKDELEAFENFKAINKDRDVYRRKMYEIREFKQNHKLEKQNELDKRINLEAVQYESDVNARKGVYSRSLEALKKELQDFIDERNKESYPVKYLKEEYNKQMKAIKKEYTHKLNLANIIFFFKINDLVVLSSNEISNKMVQGLGVSVFTKQYLIEIPHDAYYLSDDGFELDVVKSLDYGTKQYLHCRFDDGLGAKDLYLETNDKVENKKIKVLFDIEKVHITEKSMDIKIY